MPSRNEITYERRPKFHCSLNVAQRMVQLFIIIIVTMVVGPFAWATGPVPVFVSINPQKYFVQQIGKNLVTVQFMVFHPSWGYFARTYGLQQVAAEIEGKDPKPAQLKELIEHAKAESINIIFVQPQFSTKSAQSVAREIGGHLVVADPLAADWLANLRNVAQKFKAALK